LSVNTIIIIISHLQPITAHALQRLRYATSECQLQ